MAIHEWYEVTLADTLTRATEHSASPNEITPTSSLPTVRGPPESPWQVADSPSAKKYVYQF